MASGEMAKFVFIWDEEDNVPHLAEHGVTPEEAEYVVEHAGREDRAVSRTTGHPIAFGATPTRRHLAVVYWMVDEQEGLVYVETAYEVPPRTGRVSNRG